MVTMWNVASGETRSVSAPGRRNFSWTLPLSVLTPAVASYCYLRRKRTESSVAIDLERGESAGSGVADPDGA
jgi:hypothetical protein